MRGWAQARDLGIYLAQVYIVTKLVGEFVISTTWCVGPSMAPTIQPSPMGNLCLVNRTAVFTGFSVGDVVLAEHPEQTGKLIVKRVLATGGTSLAAPLANTPGTGLHKQPLVQVPEGFVWLGGDNMAMSSDSRDYGPVPQSLLLGRLAAQVWPADQASVFSRSIPDAVSRAYRLHCED
eukprot:jgi/Ulvmu1/5039/UM021_0056.1